MRDFKNIKTNTKLNPFSKLNQTITDIGKCDPIGNSIVIVSPGIVLPMGTIKLTIKNYNFKPIRNQVFGFFK